MSAESDEVKRLVSIRSALVEARARASEKSVSTTPIDNRIADIEVTLSRLIESSGGTDGRS